MISLKHLFSVMSVFLCLTLFVSCKTSTKDVNVPLIPLPNQVAENDGYFTLQNGTLLYVSSSLDTKSQTIVESFVQHVDSTLNIQLSSQALASNNDLPKQGVIFVEGGKDIPAEGYKLDVEPDRIIIKATQPAGFLYAIQTLKQLMPIEIYGKTKTALSECQIPCVSITDAPRFGYRGLMIDIARHFYTKEQMKKIIDVMTIHKLNTLHWHLTDDQGWRVEIKKYPLLTEIGGMRNKTMIRKEWENYDNIPYGGFYTQDDIKEIVKYADDNCITVIPEIDLPGHMMAALAAYPELGCTGGPYEVSGQWGIREDVLCPGKEHTFEFVEGVLTEVMELFPSTYIHIGGDECPKDRWEKCELCQTRIKEENIQADDKHSAEFFLQSYTMARVEKFLNDHGRKFIGWDEILEGEVSPSATIMSWRGMKGGKEAVRMGNQAIMTPGSHLYFDHYQTMDTDSDPLAIGGFIPVEKVYSFDPVPADLTKEEQKLILGTQANLWTEYITSNEHLEYMLLPRLAALSEVQWTSPEKKNWNNFLSRLDHTTDIYDQLGMNYAGHIYEVTGNYSVQADKPGVVFAKLTTLNDAPIYYTLDGNDPTVESMLYTSPIEITEDCTLKAFAKRGEKNTRVFKRDFVFNKATGYLATFETAPSDRFIYDGASIFTDGVRGDFNYSNGRWLGYLDNPIETIIDFGTPTSVSSVKVGVMIQIGEWLFPPTKVSVWTANADEEFVLQSSIDIPVATEDIVDGLTEYGCTFDEVQTQKIKLQIETTGVIPEWHSAKGEKGFLFVDEIVVD